MNQHTVHEYLMKKPLVMITQPFGQDVDVYKVNHKMFATLAEGKEGQTDDEGNLVDPDVARGAAIVAGILSAGVETYALGYITRGTGQAIQKQILFCLSSV